MKKSLRQDDISSWLVFFRDRGISESLISAYIPYILKLKKTNSPIIFEKQHLAHLIGIDEITLDKIINSTHSFYRKFSILKKRGGIREIVAPYPSLLQCQKWIYNNILKCNAVHEACHGFTSQRSIITNARIHTNQKCLLKMDLANFFPSIPINWVIKFFQQLGYANNVSFYLATICCYDGFLAQGAATSPYLSNLLLVKLDERISRLCEKYHLKYTRYADDLTLSGDYIPSDFSDLIKEIIDSYGLKINPEKTALLINSNKKIVTGISVSSEHIKVPREFKRKLKNEIHFIMKYGYISHINQIKIRDPNYLHSLLGKVNFWLQVEPNNLQAQTARDFIKNILKK